MTSSSTSPRQGTPVKILSIASVLALTLAFSLFGQEPSQQTAAQAPQAPQAAAAKANEEGLPPSPLSPIEKAEKDGTALRISLKDLTKLALQNNLDIAISDTQEDIYQQRLIGTYGAYDGKFTATLGVNRQKSVNTNILDQASGSYFNLNDGANWNFSFNQAVPTGGTLSASYNSGRTDSTRASNLFNPQYSASTQVSFTQPLRQNFRIDNIRTQIKLANLDLKINDSSFKKSVTDTISNIQSQYWDLVSAIRDYEIQRESVKLAQMSLRDNQKKVDVGTLAPITVVQSKADLANRELSLINSEERILSQENALRQVISNDRNSDIWKKVIVPTDSPDYKEYPVGLDQAIDTALANRPELEQLDIQLKQSDMSYRLSQNQKKWQFDVRGQFGTSANSGPMNYDRDGNPVIDPKFVGGIFNSYKNLLVGGSYTWRVDFTIGVPIRNRSLDSSIAQNRITYRQSLMNRKKLEQSIQVEVRNAVQRLETMKKSVETSRVGRELAQAQLDGEMKRFEAGLSEAYRVLDQQRALSQAMGSELTALINYKKAIITLQKAMYTLLEANDFQVAKSSSASVPDLK